MCSNLGFKSTSIRLYLLDIYLEKKPDHDCLFENCKHCKKQDSVINIKNLICVVRSS